MGDDMKQTPFSRFESLAQRLIEGSFRRLLGSGLDPLELWEQLGQALERCLEQRESFAHFLIHLHPDDYRAILAERPLITQELSDYLVTLLQRANIPFSRPPQVELIADLVAQPREISIETGGTRQTRAFSTQVFAREQKGQDALAALRQLDAFLIVGGRQHVPLDKPVIHIGRRMENDVVVDAPTVSRSHAQIRWRLGHFVLYDLSNRGRTAVNGCPVTEHVLKPGDVIHLSDVALIYGEGGEAAERPLTTSDLDDQTLAMRREE